MVSIYNNTLIIQLDICHLMMDNYQKQTRESGTNSNNTSNEGSQTKTENNQTEKIQPTE